MSKAHNMKMIPPITIRTMLIIWALSINVYSLILFSGVSRCSSRNLSLGM